MWGCSRAVPCCTDWKPDNVLIVDGRARLVDWAWAASGAAWIDPALWVNWLIASGHSAAGAESLAALHPAWDTTPVAHIDAFARAQQRLWESITQADPPGAWTHKCTQRHSPGLSTESKTRRAFEDVAGRQDDGLGRPHDGVLLRAGTVCRT